MAVKDVHDILRSVYNRNQEKKALQKHHIFLTDYDHSYTLEYIELREKNEYEINIRGDGDEEQLLFIFSHFLISPIELIFIITPQYVYTRDICYYNIISFIFQPLLRMKYSAKHRARRF